MNGNWPSTVSELVEECERLEDKYDLYEIGVPSDAGSVYPDGTAYLAGEYRYGVAMIPAQWVTHVLVGTMGDRTCHIEERNGDWYCDMCGEMVGTCDPASELLINGNAVELWEFCPRCGRKIEVSE